MYRQPSKRKQLIQRIVIYSFMSIAVVVLVIILVFVMLGYQYESNGRIEQGGLVQFDSQPRGATITIDGADFGTRTASKTTMTSGQHFITMSLTGYRTWQKSIDVMPGSVLWLSYTRLVPKQLTSKDIATLPSLSSTASSPDDKWMAMEEDTTMPTIRLADLSQDPPKLTNLDLPSNSYTHPDSGHTQSFSLVTWDPGSRYLLVKHTYDTKTEWIVVDTQNISQTKNVSTLLGIDASKVLFSGNNSMILYAQIGTDIRKIDLTAATLSRPLVTNVADFSLFNNTTITYATLSDPSTKERQVGYYQDGATQPVSIRSYPDDGQPLHLTVGNYFGDTYTAVAYGDTVTIFKGNLPQVSAKGVNTLTTVSTMTLPGAVQYLADMANGRFVIAQTGATYEVYDIELKKVTQTTLKGTGDVTSQLQWLDDYTLWSDRDNMLRLYEFDGTNQNDIMSVTAGFSATLSPDSKYIYGILRAFDGQYHLERVQMIL